MLLCVGMVVKFWPAHRPEARKRHTLLLLPIPFIITLSLNIIIFFILILN